jgi:hypothetical protein
VRTVELDRIVVACLGAQGVPLHNQFISCLWQNAQCNRVPSSLETVAQQKPSISERCTRIKQGEALTVANSNYQQQLAPAKAAGLCYVIHAFALIALFLYLSDAALSFMRLWLSSLIAFHCTASIHHI